MIRARASAPYRISLGGGGSDLPAYANEFGGFIVATSIDKRVEVEVAWDRDGTGILLELQGVVSERRANADQLSHGICREALRWYGLTGKISIRSRAELPAESGLGSSSSFTVALCAALAELTGAKRDPAELLEVSYGIESDRLGGQLGKQDAAVAAYGGLLALGFERDGTVQIERLQIAPEVRERFFGRLLVFDTHTRRQAQAVLSAQSQALRSGSATERMHGIKALGQQVLALLKGDTPEPYARLLHEHFLQKRAQIRSISSDLINAHYEAALGAGARGGKLMGAGGGGFLLVSVEPGLAAQLISTLEARGLTNLPLGFGGPGVLTHSVAGASVTES